MDITLLTKLITIVLAVSLASERLVTLLKTTFPALASPTVAPGAPVPPINGKERRRQIIVMAIAFLAAWLTASFLNKGTFDPIGPYALSGDFKIPIWVIGILASGGSAFWTSLLGYTRAVKDLSNQKVQANLNTNAQQNTQQNTQQNAQ